MQHFTAYDPLVTKSCERALVTVIGNAGFWGRYLYLVGGLAAGYLCREASQDAPAHVGSRDVDLAIVLAIGDAAGGDYETLVRNLRDGGFTQAPLNDDPDFRWRREVDDHSIVVEFLGESADVMPGRSFKPKGGSGSTFQALNIPGVRLVVSDYQIIPIPAERLDTGGRSTVSVRVTRLLPFIVLKILAYDDRHHAKDAYDLVHVLRNQAGGAGGAGRLMAASPVASDAFVVAALSRLAERFADPANDAPTYFGLFMSVGNDQEVTARYRNAAVAVVSATLESYRGALRDGS